MTAATKPTKPAPLVIPEDESLKSQIAALIAAHNAKAAQQEQASAEGIRFIFAHETPNREIGASVWVKNRFGNQEGGTVLERVAEGLHRVRIFDNLIILVHEPDAAWYE